MNEQQNYTVSPSEKTMPPQKSKKKIVIPIVILGFIIIVGFLIWLYVSLFLPNHSSEQSMNLFSRDLVAVKTNDKWGFVNTEGTLVITPQYDDYSISSSSSNDLIAVCSDKKWGYIDPSGTLIIPYQYDSAAPF